MKNQLILIRGLPGSGKTTLGEMFRQTSQLANFPAVHLEADQWFIQDGEYKFRPTELPLAHASTQSKVKIAMQRKIPTIIVSNTFTTEAEKAPYLHMAAEYWYEVLEYLCLNKFPSVHNVPEATIEKMRKRFQVKV